MATDQKIRVNPLKSSELNEAGRIVRLAFGTFLGLPDPMAFMEDRDFLAPRMRSKNVKALAARDGGRLIGSNFVTRWGSFGFFGPLTVLPEYWDRGVAQKLLEATVGVFDKWGVRHTGLFTFASSAKHVGLYQKFGYWPQHLTAVMTKTPELNSARPPELLSALKKADREELIAAAAKLTHRISKGLNLTDEIRSVLKQRTGDVVVERRRGVLNGFAICMTGAGSEGGAKICYIKFGAARDGKAAETYFGRLLDGCEAYAALKGATVEAGTNLARGEAFRHLRSRGYRVTTQGVAMQRPNAEGFNRPNCWVIDDWR
jgi:GNAT superfamily N-acetyltransferase